MKKIKVMHIVEAASGGGGVFTYIKDLSFFFGKQPNNINTTIIYSEKRPEAEIINLNKSLDNGVSTIKIDIEREISLLKDIKSIYNLIKIYRREKPEIIHLHSSKAGVLGRVASLFYRKAKVFYNPHGYSFIREDISPFKKKIFYCIEKYTAKFLGGTTIACGDTEFEYAKKIGKALLIRNGINIDTISNKKLLTPLNQKLIIGMAGRLTYARAPWIFNEIAKNNPDIDFLWIGDGELKNNITAKNITVTGWVNRDKIFDVLNKLDIYIQTSLWEGLPIAPLEAMALKKPILATNIIGNKDIIVHKKTGFLFNDIEDAQKYIEILKNQKLREQMGNSGYYRCKEIFDLNKNFTLLTNIYLDCINNSNLINKPSYN